MKPYQNICLFSLIFSLLMVPFMLRAEEKANNEAIVYLPFLANPAGKWMAAYQRSDNSSLGSTIGILQVSQNQYKLIGDNFVINLKGDGTVDHASYITAQGRSSAQMSDGLYVKGYPNIFYECDALIHLFDQNDGNLWTKVVVPPAGSCSTHLDLSAENDSIIIGQQGAILGHSAWLAKLDKNGDLAWSRLVGRRWVGGPFAITATADGGLLLTAAKSDGMHPVIIAELNGAGQLVRAREIWSNDGTLYYVPWTISSTADGETIVTGSTSNQQAWALKLDKEWQIAWQKQYNLPSEAHLYSAKVSNDGGIIFYSLRDMVKINGDGSAAWARSYGHQTAGIDLNDIQEVGDGGILVAGALQGISDHHPLSMKLGPDGMITNCDFISSQNVASSQLALIMTAVNIPLVELSPEVRTLDPGYTNPLEVESTVLCSDKLTAVGSQGNCPVE